MNSGDKHAANREPSPFAEELVKQFKKIGFRPDRKINHSGTYPLLKLIHARSRQKVVLEGSGEAELKSTHLRSDDHHMGKLPNASIQQSVMIWLLREDLPF